MTVREQGVRNSRGTSVQSAALCQRPRWLRHQPRRRAWLQGAIGWWGPKGPKGHEWPTACWAAPGPAVLGSCSEGASLRASRSERTKQDAQVRPCCLCSPDPRRVPGLLLGSGGGRQEEQTPWLLGRLHTVGLSVPLLWEGAHTAVSTGGGGGGEASDWPPRRHHLRSASLGRRKAKGHVLNPNLPTGSKRGDTRKYWERVRAFLTGRSPSGTWLGGQHRVCDTLRCRHSSWAKGQVPGWFSPL